MSTLTGEIAADVAWARPDSIDAALILGYSGPAWPGWDQIKAWGRPFLLGFESATTRAYAGYDAGRVDALWYVGREAELGYPSECGVWVCAADSPSTPGWAVGPVTDYFRAWRDVLGPWRVLVAYGNRDAVDAACAGGANRRWGVGTWGFGEGSWPNAPAGEMDADLVQSGNTPGPAEGTDLDWLYAPVSSFAPWGVVLPPDPVPVPPTPTPTTSTEDDDTMLMIATSDGTRVKNGDGLLVHGDSIAAPVAAPFPIPPAGWAFSGVPTVLCPGSVIDAAWDELDYSRGYKKRPAA